MKKIRSLIEPYIPALKLWYVFVRIWLAGLRRFPSSLGWGVVLDWPMGPYQKQMDWLLPFLDKYLGETHIIPAPAHASGGALVIYFWPNDDPRLSEHLIKKENDQDDVGLDLEPA